MLVYLIILKQYSTQILLYAQVKLTAVGLDNIHVISEAAYQQVQEFKQHSADLAMNGSAKESKSIMEVEEYYFEAYMRWLDAQVISNVFLGP